MTAQSLRRRKGPWYLLAILLSMPLVFGLLNLLGVEERVALFYTNLILGSCLIQFRRAFDSQLQPERRSVGERIARYFGLKFDPSGQRVVAEDFRDLGLVPDFSTQRRQDGFHGTLWGARFQFAEVKLTVGKEKPVFTGALAVAGYQGERADLLFVTRDAGFLRNQVLARKYKGERLRLEDPKFERYFEVYGNDQVRGRYLLSPAMIEKLNAMAERTENSEFAFAISSGKIWIVLPIPYSRFDMRWSLSDFDGHSALRYAELLRLCRELVGSVNQAGRRARRTPLEEPAALGWDTLFKRRRAARKAAAPEAPESAEPGAGPEEAAGVEEERSRGERLAALRRRLNRIDPRDRLRR